MNGREEHPSQPAEPPEGRRAVGAARRARHHSAPRPIVGASRVTLRYLGTAVNQSKEIAQKVEGGSRASTIEYVPVTTDDVTKRIITQPASFDVADAEYFQLRKLIPSGNLIGMDAKRIKYADKITPVFTKGEVAGKTIGDQGTAPKKVFYLEGPTSTQVLVDADAVDHAHPDRLQRRHARHPARPDQASDRARGRSCSTRSSRARRRSSTSRRSASWTPPWWSRRWACTSTATRAT